MKKLFKPLALLLIVLVPLFAFMLVACFESQEPEQFLLITSDSLENSNHEFIGGVLDELAESDGLTFTYSNTAFGRMILTLGNLVPNASNNEFIAVYISILEPQWSNPYSVTVDGVQFFSANHGIDSLPVLDGVSYLFAIATF